MKAIKNNLPKDRNQAEYRSFFGIEDEYLIQYQMEGEEGWIVFIDSAGDIDWVDKRSNFFNEQEKTQKDVWIAKLDAVHMEPCTNIGEADKLTFKKKLAVGYELCLVKQFDEIQPVIDECTRFIHSRNKETSRTLFLRVSLPIALLSIVGWAVDVDFLDWHTPWVTGVVMGVLGSFVSIWSRFGKIEKTGLSSRWLHVLECLCRMLVGVIFAIVAILAIKTGVLLKDIDSSLVSFAYGMAGFASGFCERFVPSMIENLVKNNTSKPDNDDKA